MAKRRLTLGQVVIDTICITSITVLLTHHNAVSEAVRQGFVQCCQSVIPALFPMMAAVSFLIGCGFGSFFPPVAAALLLGLVGGYPTGARIVGELCRAGQLDRRDAQRLLCCCNHAGPAFILGLAGEIFSHSLAGWALCLIHILSALLMALLIVRPVRPTPPVFLPVSPAAVFVSAIRSAAASMGSVCAIVILFRVILSLVEAFTGLTSPLLWGAIELTNGILSVPDSKAGFICAAALLGWGGLSVHCQSMAMLEGTGLKLAPYLLAKLGQALLSALLAMAAVPYLF